MSDGWLLARALRDPASVAVLNAQGWTDLLAIARAEQMIGTLAYRLEGVATSGAVARILAGARVSADHGRTLALWEAEVARRVLAPLGVPVVLLKGTAFAAAGLEAGVGRSIGDLDILVPRASVDAVEAALLAAGWEWVKPDPYDDAYYRQWMHELPPLIHRDRDRMIDVHHTFLPLTARITPDAEALLADSVGIAALTSNPTVRFERSGETATSAAQGFSTSLETNGWGGGVRVLSPNDMLVHAAAHLFADGDLAGGMRNLWDVHCLLAQFGTEGLAARAAHHGLSNEVSRALRLAAVLYAGERSMPIDRLYLRRLTARDGWGRETRPFVRHAFYVRSHWLRMPPAMLVRHLWTKWRKGGAGPGSA